MPVHPISPERARKTARTLTDLCHAVPLHRAQEAVARMLGHPHWHALVHAPAQPSAEADHALVPEAFRARRLAQGAALAQALEIPLDNALWARNRMHLHGPSADADPNPPAQGGMRFLMSVSDLKEQIPDLPGRRGQGDYRVPTAWRVAVLTPLRDELDDDSLQVFRLRWRPCQRRGKIQMRARVGETRGTTENVEMQMPKPDG
jgi:hypothetical protein